MYHVSHNLSPRKRSPILSINDKANIVDTNLIYSHLEQDPKFQFMDKQIKQIVDELIQEVIAKINLEPHLDDVYGFKINQKSFPGTALFTNKSIPGLH